MGRMTRIKVCQWLAPSTKAASSMALGRPLMKFIMMITFQMLMAEGSISTQKLSSRCRFLMTM